MPKKKAAKAAARPGKPLRVSDALEQMESRRRKRAPQAKNRKDLDLDFIP